MPRCLLVLLCLALLIAKAHAGTYCIRAYTTANGKESLPTNFVTREVTAPATDFKVSWTNAASYDDNSPLPVSEITQTRVAWGTCAGDVFTKLGEQKLSGAPTSTILSLDDPTPPTPKVLSTTSTIAYVLVNGNNRLTFLIVGSVPLGTPCLGAQEANGFNVVPRSAVKFDGPAQPTAVLAKCALQ